MEIEKILVLLGKRIRQLREKQGLTQEKASDKSKSISVKRWSDVERGKHNITFYTVLAITKGLNVPLPELFKFGNKQPAELKNPALRKKVVDLERKIKVIDGEMGALKKDFRELVKLIKHF